MATSLPIPAAAERDPAATHLASIWVAEGGLHCNLNLGVYANHPTVTETTAWGTILADMVQIIAGGLVSQGVVEGTQPDVTSAIWNAFHERMSAAAGT